MASYTAAKSKHQTLAANTVDTVTLSQDHWYVEVSNWGVDRLYFTVDGSTPTVGGDDTWVVGGGGSLRVATGGPSAEAYKLICASPNAYSVQAVFESRVF